MKTTFISTYAVSSSTRLQVAKLQSEITDAQKELVTGRHADVGNALGYRTGYVVSLRREQAQLTAITDSNGLVATNLDVAQGALGGIIETAQSFVTAVIAARGGDQSLNPKILQSQAADALGALTQALNTSIGGSYIFAGINTGQPVLGEYFADPAPANRQAIAADFTAAFGIGQGDPGVDLINATDMQNFLDTSFAAQFESAAWTAQWSAASDETMSARISRDQVVATSVSANEEAFRKLAMAFTMVADLGVENLGTAAFDSVAETAIIKASEAIAAVTVHMGTLGVAQQRVTTSNERMSIQMDVFIAQISGLEQVDPFEAATRVTSLLTQIETAYAMTARIQRLSLLEYLR